MLCGDATEVCGVGAGVGRRMAGKRQGEDPLDGHLQPPARGRVLAAGITCISTTSNHIVLWSFFSSFSSYLLHESPSSFSHCRYNSIFIPS